MNNRNLMITISRTAQFKKEFKLAIKRGKNQSKFTDILEILLSGNPVPMKYRDHKLSGCFDGSRELHIEPDWLLIYQLSKDSLILERTGTHSDLFK